MKNNNSSKNSVQGWLRPILIIIPYLISVGIFQFIGFTILGLDPDNQNQTLSTAQNLIISVFSLAGTLFIVFVFRSSVDKESFVGLGFSPKNLLKDLSIGLIVCLGILIPGFFILFFTKQIQVTGFHFNLPNILCSILLFISISIGEEIFFRGYILKNLMLSFNRWIALMASALLFSGFHVFNNDFSWISFVNLFLSGILIGLPIIYNRSLWYSISLHFGWNFIQGTIFGFNVSGHETYSIIKHKNVSSNILDNDIFGFEGSIVCTVLSLIFIFIIAYKYVSNNKFSIFFRLFNFNYIDINITCCYLL